VIIIFSLIASALNIRFGLVKGLMISGIAMAATNLMFSWIALVGPVKSLFAAAIIVDNFTASFATVAFVSFISYLTNRAYTATQYALLASLGNFGRTTLAAFSGIMVDYLDGNWPLFFLITALMVVPALLMLMLLAKRINHY
jgi:PAT family beta-lactamase induction signal transducer AmpG